MDKLKLSTANIVILVAGVVMLIASFLAFNKISTPVVQQGRRVRSAAARTPTARGAATSS